MKEQNNQVLFRNTIDNLMEGFQLIGYDWRYLYVNNAVVAQSKCESKEDLLGFTMMEKYPGIENTELFRMMEKCMKDRRPAQMENEFSFPDGSKGWFQLIIEPVPDGISILSIDISPQKRSEEEKRKYFSSLEEMLFMTSHKVRQPVANILGVTNLMEGNSAPEDLRKMISYLRESALSLDEFTRELTVFMHNMKQKAAG